MTTCTSCGAALEPGAARCDLCGTPTAAPDARTDATPALGACPNCGNVPPAASPFCNACGEPMPEAAPVAEPSDAARPPVARPARPSAPSSAAGKRTLAVVGVGLVVVVALYGLTVLAPKPAAVPEPAPETPEVGEAPAIPPGTPPLPDSLQAAADAFAAQGTAEGFYESGRYYLTAAFQLVQQDPVASVRFARRAIEEFDRSLAIQDDPRVRVALAEAATFDPSDPMRPVQELRAVLEADPDNLDAVFLLADRRALIGRTELAREGFEKVVAEADPGSVVHQRAVEALADLEAAGG